MEGNIANKKLSRDPQNGIICGVSAGIGEYLGIDSTIIRVLFILLTLFGGTGIILYIILCIIMPSNTSTNTNPNDNLRDNINEMSDKAREFSYRMGSRNHPRVFVAFLFILIGIYFLLNNFGLFYNIDLGRLWPVWIILLGLLILFSR